MAWSKASTRISPQVGGANGIGFLNERHAPNAGPAARFQKSQHAEKQAEGKQRREASLFHRRHHRLID
jgi:hypothetical protein